MAAKDRTDSTILAEATMNSFECGAVDWDAYTRTPHGSMRQTLVLEHLHSHLPQAPLEILDVGAGTGGYALDLARAGHRVTLVDFSPRMLDLAHGHFSETGPDVLERATFVVSPVASLDRNLAGARYDVVLMHTLLEYLPSPSKTLESVIELASPGAIVSLLLVNTCGSVIRQAMVKRNPADALAALRGSPPPTALFGEGRRLIPLDVAWQALANANVEIVSHRGIRIFADAYAPDALARDETFESVLELELAAGGADPYRQIGRYHHLLGILRTATSCPREDSRF